MSSLFGLLLLSTVLSQRPYTCKDHKNDIIWNEEEILCNNHLNTFGIIHELHNEKVTGEWLWGNPAFEDVKALVYFVGDMLIYGFCAIGMYVTFGRFCGICCHFNDSDFQEVDPMLHSSEDISSNLGYVMVDSDQGTTTNTDDSASTDSCQDDINDYSHLNTDSQEVEMIM